MQQNPFLGVEFAQAFGRPALIDIRAHLAEAVGDGQVSESADVDATIDLSMVIIVFVGATREDVARIPAVIPVLRSVVANQSSASAEALDRPPAR